MTRELDDEREDVPDRARAPAPPIPGAWAAPAGAFVDEGTVVRPERHVDDRGRKRVPRLLLLALLSAGTAGFAWGVTVALQGLESDQVAPAPPQVAASEPAAKVAAVPMPVDEAEAATIGVDEDERRGTPKALEGAESEAAVPVPAADPTFPGLPTSDDDLDGAEDADTSDDVDDVPTPKRLRLALENGDADAAEEKKQRYKRPSRKTQKLSKATASNRSAKAKAKKKEGHSTTTSEGGRELPASAAAASESPPATASSLTLQAEKLFSRGELSPARALAERAIERSAGYPRAHRALAVICAKQGDSACARSGYETYLKLAPDAPDAPDVRRILGM